MADPVDIPVPADTAAASVEPAAARPRPWLARLEVWLILAALVLLLQLYPAAFWGLLYLVDVRNWSWGGWVGVEIGVVVILIALRIWQTSD